MYEPMLAVLHKWDLQPTSITPITDNVYQVMTEEGQRFIFKREVKPEYIRCQKPLYTYLRDNGFPSPTVVGDCELVDGQYAVLYTYVPGDVVRDDMPLNVLQRSRIYGSVAGHLHRLLKHYPNSHDFGKVDLYEHIFDWALPIIITKEGADSIQRVVSRMDELKAELTILQGLPVQLIHRDLHRGNFLLCDDDFCGLIDFDGCQQNVRLFDPLYMATSILAERYDEAGRAAWIEVLERILTGYHAVNPLTDSEWAAVLYVVLSIQVIFVAFMADQAPEAAEMNAKMFHWIWEQRETIQERMRKVSSVG